MSWKMAKGCKRGWFIVDQVAEWLVKPNYLGSNPTCKVRPWAAACICIQCLPACWKNGLLSTRNWIYEIPRVMCWLWVGGLEMSWVWRIAKWASPNLAMATRGAPALQWSDPFPHLKLRWLINVWPRKLNRLVDNLSYNQYLNLEGSCKLSHQHIQWETNLRWPPIHGKKQKQISSSNMVLETGLPHFHQYRVTSTNNHH